MQIEASSFDLVREVPSSRLELPITSKSSKFKGATQHYKCSKIACARRFCPNIQECRAPLAPVRTQALKFYVFRIFNCRHIFLARLHSTYNEN